MKTKILMVCLGNICRSPLAEGLLKSKLDPQKFTVDSAGTGSWHIGNSPDSRSVDVAAKNGLDISDQRGMLFKSEFFQEYDHIFVMDSSNLSDVRRLARTEAEKQKVSLILDEAPELHQKHVPDPYSGGLKGFDKVYALLDTATDRLAARLTQS
ncbi:MAG: low molecular weight protein-tyrosine-phosphatase [Leeuwenhoekiella sp.]